jgi:hypothetical protein
MLGMYSNNFSPQSQVLPAMQAHRCSFEGVIAGTTYLQRTAQGFDGMLATILVDVGVLYFAR